MEELHPNWRELIRLVEEWQFGRAEITFENGTPVNCKKAVQNIRLGKPKIT